MSGDRDQAVATDPARSAVVVACAGSGKTRLLVSRIVRILESGAKPGEILAVTFTRKAAAEIRGRVLEALRERRPDIRRRILLAEAPEDALAVSTFHGWFLSLSALRPWSDARRDPPRVGDDNNEPLLNEAWRNWLDAESDSDAARELTNFITPRAVRELLRKFAQNAAPWRLRERLSANSANSENSASSENEAAAERIAEERLRESAARFAKQAAGRGKVLEAAIHAAHEFASGDLSGGELRAAFLTAKHQRRARLVAEDDSLIEEMVAALLNHLGAVETARAAVFSRAALAAGGAFMRELDAVKARRHIAGFDDLEFSAWEALARPGGGEAEALRYRLDCKYRHILIDEFQDTSPIQWQVMRAWLEDAHGSDESPSVFIVGDPRQSIYHWRGGDPRLLDSASKFLRAHYAAAALRQNICRRCAPQILQAVNAVFDGAEDFVPHESPNADEGAEESRPGNKTVDHSCRRYSGGAHNPDATASASFPQSDESGRTLERPNHACRRYSDSTSKFGLPALRGRWRENFPMSKLSTWRVGGPARAVFEPADLADLKAFLAAHACASSPSPMLFVGHGSNLLVRDGGFPGVVVRAAPGLSELRMEDDDSVYAEAGVACAKAARFCARKHLAGAEFLAGIPGAVGGALAMNAGCHGDEIWSFVRRVLVADENGETVLRPEDFSVNYREVRLKGRRGRKGAPFFAAAWLKFPKGDAKIARAKLDELLRKRRETQPLDSPSAGSVFRNPPGDFAGRLVESCGLKGAREGGAEVSRKHGNFIVNRGDARAKDVEALMARVRKAVRARTGIMLVPEVRIAGVESDGG